MCATAGQGGDRTSEDAVDLAGEVAFEFPESSQATARLCSARRVRGLWDGVPVCQQAQMTRSQARATMRVA
jgi:hypothetical protein